MMDLEVKEVQPKFYDNVTNMFLKNTLSHAFLIETNNNEMDVIKTCVLFLVKKLYEYSYQNGDVLIAKEKLFHLIDEGEFPDYLEIYPKDNIIRKEQLLMVKNDFVNKSLYNTFKIYCVFEAEKMNVNAANTILKFLEEPNSFVIGIFVTSNSYNIIDTIKSRCQLISLYGHNDNSLVTESVYLDFFNDIDKRNEKDLMLNFNKYVNFLFQNKPDAIKTIHVCLQYYKGLLDKNKENYDSRTELISIISIFQEKLKNLNNNVNMKLWLDDLLLSLMEVKKYESI